MQFNIIQFIKSIDAVDAKEKAAITISNSSALKIMGSVVSKESQSQGKEGQLLDSSPKIVITSKGSDGVLKLATFDAGKLFFRFQPT